MRVLTTALFVVSLAAVSIAQTRVKALPYTTVTLADGGNYVLDVTAPRYDTPGSWKRTLKGALPRMRQDEWVQIMADGKDGWRTTVLRIGRDGRPMETRHNDRNHRLDAPWYSDGRYQDGWYRVWPSAPPGHPGGAWNELDLKPLLTVKTSGSTIRFTGRNAPSEGLQLHGNGNQVHVDLAGGPKVGLQIDRAELRVYGDRNKLTGTVRTEMVAVRVNGNDNELRDMTLYGLEVGNDVGLVVFPGRGFNGNKAYNVTAVCPRRQYPVTWVHTGFYLDDKASHNVVQGSRVKGFQSGVFVHGGSDNRIDVTAENCEVAVSMNPHFTTPREMPRNPAPTVRKIGSVEPDRRVAKLAKNG